MFIIVYICSQLVLIFIYFIAYFISYFGYREYRKSITVYYYYAIHMVAIGGN